MLSLSLDSHAFFAFLRRLSMNLPSHFREIPDLNSRFGQSKHP